MATAREDQAPLPLSSALVSDVHRRPQHGQSQLLGKHKRTQTYPPLPPDSRKYPLWG